MADRGQRRAGRPLIVLTSMRAERSTTNPYVVQLNRLLADRVEMRTFSWWAALGGRYDVLHVHWPDAMLRRPSAARTALASAAFVLVLARIFVTRRAVVRTLHNVEPHEKQQRFVRLALGLCDASTRVWIRLNDHTPIRAGGVAVTIPHGTYTQWFANLSHPAPIPGRLLYLGLLRPYKGVDTLIEQFAAVEDLAATLRVIGSPAEPRFADAVRALAAGDPRVFLDLRHVPDDEMVSEIGAAAMVVLPYREMHNSGVALLALSLARPILVPDNDVTRDLAAEVGPGWVQTFVGEITAEVLADAIAHAGTAEGQPDLSARGWDDIADRHVTAFRLAEQAARPRSAAAAPQIGAGGSGQVQR